MQVMSHVVACRQGGEGGTRLTAVATQWLASVESEGENP